MGTCSGTSEDHCCYLPGGVCKYLEKNTVAGRTWVCGIRKNYTSWDETHADDKYIRDVKPLLDQIGLSNCGDWPRKDEICATCGVKG